MWWLLIPAIIGLWIVIGLRMSARNLRVIAYVHIPADAPSIVRFEPPQPKGEDLIRLGMVYAAKLRWVLLSEPVVSQELFDQIFSEMSIAWLITENDLIGSMPTARMIRDMKERPLAVAGGEQFVIRYSRISYTALRNRSSMHNSLPRPGLAANLVWNYVILVDSIHRSIDAATRVRAKRALGLFAARLGGRTLNDSLSCLNQLIKEADSAWEDSVLEPAA
jgi:hypothetical protein